MQMVKTKYNLVNKFYESCGSFKPLLFIHSVMSGTHQWMTSGDVCWQGNTTEEVVKGSKQLSIGIST